MNTENIIAQLKRDGIGYSNTYKTEENNKKKTQTKKEIILYEYQNQKDKQQAKEEKTKEVLNKSILYYKAALKAASNDLDLAMQALSRKKYQLFFSGKLDSEFEICSIDAAIEQLCVEKANKHGEFYETEPNTKIKYL